MMTKVSEAFAWSENDNKKPVAEKPIENLGFLRVGGLYRRKNANEQWHALVISITEQTFWTWPNDVAEPRLTKKLFVEYLVNEEIWEWTGEYNQLPAWEHSYERLR